MINLKLSKFIKLQTILCIAACLLAISALFILFNFVQNKTWDSYIHQGRVLIFRQKYTEAERSYRNALGIAERFGPSDERLPQTLFGLAEIYQHEDRNSEAGKLYEKLLAMDEKKYGTTDTAITASLRNLAAHYFLVGRHEDAELLFKRALAIREQAPYTDLNESNVIISLENLIIFYNSQSQFRKAEPLLLRRLTLVAQLSDCHFSRCLKDLAENRLKQNDLEHALPLLQQRLLLAHEIDQNEYFSELLDLAQTYSKFHCVKEAELCLEKLDRVADHIQGQDSWLAGSFVAAAKIYKKNGNETKAKALLHRAQFLTIKCNKEQMLLRNKQHYRPGDAFGSAEEPFFERYVFENNTSDRSI